MLSTFRIVCVAINYVAFYLIWFLGIWASIEGYGLPVFSLVVLYLIAHLALISHNPRNELYFIVLLMAMGASSDAAFSLSGLIVYQYAILPGIAWWTLSLWACFGTTFWHAFSWLESHPILASILGASVAPVCYAGIEESGAIAFVSQRSVVLCCIAIFWSFFLPLTFHLSKKIRSRS